jgi:O-antigen/teichoic acid export membrane protein
VEHGMTLHRQAAGLTVMHAAEVLQPLLILPYAGIVLGPTGFGQYSYVLALVNLANICVDYGFTWTARRAAAPIRHDIKALRLLFAEVVAAKGILCSCVLFIALAGAEVSSSISIPTFLCITVSALGAVLFPSWLFLGLERTWQAAGVVVVARTFALVAFFLLIKSPNDAELAAGIQAAIPLMSAVISIPFMLAIGLGGFRSLMLGRVVSQLTGGWKGFVSWLSQAAVLILPIPLVEHVGGFAAVGQFSVADKLYSAVRTFFGIMQQTLMPRVAYLASHDPKAGLSLIWNSLWLLVIAVFFSIFLYFAGPYFILLIFGSEYIGAASLARAMCILPILLNIRISLTDLYMFNYGHEKAWSLLALAGLGTFLAAFFTISYWIDAAMAAAIAAVISEAAVALIAIGFVTASIIKANRVARVRDANAVYSGGETSNRNLSRSLGLRSQADPVTYTPEQL